MKQSMLQSVAVILLCCVSQWAWGQNNTWKTNGNANGGNVFLGTTDSTDLQLKTNGSTRITVGANGNVGLGTPSPTTKLDLGAGAIRVRDYAGLGLRLLAVDSNGLINPTEIGLKGGSGLSCSPVIDGWGIENPNLTTLRLCGSYTSVQIGNQGITNYGNLSNLQLDVRGDFRVGGDVGFNKLASGTGLNIVYADPNGKLTLAPNAGIDPFWGTFGTNVLPGMFIGSRNPEDLLLKTNNATRLVIASTGAITVPTLAGSGDVPVMVDAGGKLWRSAGGAYWETGGNQVANGQVLGALNNVPLKFVTNGAPRMLIASSGEVAINGPSLADIMLNIDARNNVGIALRARTHATSASVYPYCIQAVVNTDNTKAFAVFNEAITNGNCQNGEDVFRVWGDGRVEAKRIKVFVNNWCDYVFEKTYDLRSLDEVNTYIQAYGHLPEVPATSEVVANGVDVGDMQALLLKKIEELTLYAIAQQQRCDALEQKIMELKTQLDAR